MTRCNQCGEIACACNMGWGHTGPCQPNCTCVMSRMTTPKPVNQDIFACKYCGKGLMSAQGVAVHECPVSVVNPGKSYSLGRVDELKAQLKQAIEERDEALEKLATTSKGSLSVEAMLAKLEVARWALEYYADKNEWIDYKATGVAAGRIVHVDSHFDGDLGQHARDALERIKG